MWMIGVDGLLEVPVDLPIDLGGCPAGHTNRRANMALPAQAYSFRVYIRRASLQASLSPFFNATDSVIYRLNPNPNPPPHVFPSLYSFVNDLAPHFGAICDTVLVLGL